MGIKIEEFEQDPAASVIIVILVDMNRNGKYPSYETPF
jgi:hypothetical protein